jgi:uncharacterized membrane protein
MATLTVWKFDTPNGADDALATVKNLQSQVLLDLQDAALMSWPKDAKKPRVKQLHDAVGVGALGGAFWGLLFGLLFFVPLLGLAIGAGLGAVAASVTDAGIDDKFIKQVRGKLVPGTSALFLLTENVVQDRVAAQMRTDAHYAELIQSNLSVEQETKLREMFGAEHVPSSEATAPEGAEGPTTEAARPEGERPTAEPTRPDAERRIGEAPRPDKDTERPAAA